MKRIFFVIIIVLFTHSVLAQGNQEEGRSWYEDTVKLPVNVYDSFEFSKESSPYVRTGLYIFGPLFMAAYGFGTWGWNSKEDFTVHPETFRGPYAIDGAADKFGHLYGNFIMKRLMTFLFHASGSSRNRANLEGAILTWLVTFGGELGDGFSKNYGFDPYDVMFNTIGILAAITLDWSVFLDRIFTIKWEYVPTREMREKFDLMEHHDIFTDYSGSKFILTTKLGGIPYISLTPLRYLNIDVGYYSRGYNPAKYYASRTRNIYLGFSINYSIASGDLLPQGYTTSSMMTFFNYIHLPWDYEAKKWELSNKPHEEFE